MGAETSEIIEGPTPNGGSYSVASFYDNASNPCEKSNANRVEISEYDKEFNFILNTSLMIEPGPRASYAAYAKDRSADPGITIALYPSEDLANDLAVPGGEPPEELHVTLAYLGRVSEVGRANLAKIERAVKLAVMDQRPLSGTIGGRGRFPASESSDGMGVLYAGVDMPGLVELRQEIVRACHNAGRGKRAITASRRTSH